jgi:hypothetical protein
MVNFSALKVNDKKKGHQLLICEQNAPPKPKSLKKLISFPSSLKSAPQTKIRDVSKPPGLVLGCSNATFKVTSALL